jgi:tetratricopeptide (TPR) repeat protein
MCQLLSGRRAASAFLLVAVLARGAAAQQGRISGLVNDEDGRPIKAATVIAEMPDTGQTFTSSTDDKGRFSMIGLRAGQWSFIAQAPDHAPSIGKVMVRASTPNAPMAFTLVKRGVVAGPLGGVNIRDLQAQLTAADALFNQEKWDDAIAAYRTIITKTPGLVMINLQVAAAYLNKNDYPAAIAAYNELLKTNPNNEKAALGIGTTMLKQGDEKGAEEALLKLAQAPDAGRDVFFTLAEMKIAKGQSEEAAKWYRKACDSDPSWGKPLYKLGMLAMNGGDKQSAATLMDKVLAVDPESPEAALAKTAINQLKQ